MIKKVQGVINTLLVITAGIGLPVHLNAQAVAKAKPVIGGSYFSLTLNRPPLPMNPFPELPVTEVQPGIFVYDDTGIDYFALEEERIAQHAAKMTEGILQFDELDGGGGGMMMLMGEGGTNLMLSLPVIQGTNVSMQIINANTSEPYDLYATTTLGSTNAWLYLGRAPAGQTNLSTPVISGPTAVFTVANTADTDGDTLPDALEELATQTNPQAADTPQNVPPGSLAATLLTNRPPRIRTSFYERNERYFWYCSDNLIAGWDDKSIWSLGTGGSVISSNITCLPRETNVLTMVTWDGEGHPTPANGTVPPTFATGYHIRYLSGDVSANHRKDYMTTELQLETGGQSLSTKQHLFIFDPTAWYVENFGQHANTPPDADISVFGDSPDAAGYIWRLFPDNQKIAVPFGLPESYTNYVVEVSFVKVGLRLKRAGIDISDSTQTVWVGERMELQCVLQGFPYAVLASPSNFVWSVPGNAIGNYAYNSSTASVITNFPKTNSTINYYWVDGVENAVVQCSALVNGIALNAQATFKVKRPEATLRLTPKWHVEVSSDYCAIGGSTRLQTGKQCSTNDVGMLYEFILNDLKGYPLSHQFQLVQIATFDDKENLPQEFGVQRSREVLIRGLDGSYPYEIWGSPQQYGTADDTPASPLQAAFKVYEWRRDQFECYLMFKPSGGIPVPLKLATWSWKGQAAWGGAQGWSGILPYEHPQPAIGADIYSHPTWTNNASAFTNFWTTNQFWFAP